MPRASGLQIAFLILAVEFFSMLASRRVTLAMGWSGEALEILARTLGFAVAAAALFGVPALRRPCLADLAAPWPRGMTAELAAVAAVKAAIPLAILGAGVAWAFALGDPESIAGPPRTDPDAAWAWTLSPLGLARMVILSWIAGPILEELVFRGFLYRAWERRWGWITSTILTSACFGLAHPAHVASAFLGSLVYVFVLRRTGTLRACIAVHMAYNILVSWPLLGQVLHHARAGDPASLSTWTLPLACLTLVCVTLPAYAWMARRESRPASDAATPGLAGTA